MIRISKMADYAVVILVCLSRRQDQMMSASAIAEDTKLPEPTVSKILKSLARENIVKSTRGTNGGYVLVDKADDLGVARIIEVMDGPIAITSCSDGHAPDCGLAGSCGVRGRWDDVNAVIREALENVSLADMSGKRNFEAKEAAYGRH